MKQKKMIVALIGSIAALTLVGWVATWTPPSVTFAAPPPIVAVDVAPAPGVFVPETYVWDGFEFVGVVGADYVYLGPGGVWLRCEPWRLGRFHGWERGHADWRGHAIRNEHYRGSIGHGPVGHGPGPRR